MKPRFHAFSALALASCILAAVFTVEAQKKPRKAERRGRRGGASDFAAAGKDSHGAACFTQALCNALKKTCKGRY